MDDGVFADFKSVDIATFVGCPARDLSGHGAQLFERHVARLTEFVCGVGIRGRGIDEGECDERKAAQAGEQRNENDSSVHDRDIRQW